MDGLRLVLANKFTEKRTKLTGWLGTINKVVTIIILAIGALKKRIFLWSTGRIGAWAVFALVIVTIDEMITVVIDLIVANGKSTFV
jgi:hypothetical protein